MNLLWQYLKPFKYWVALALLLAGIAQILTLYDPIIFGQIIDEYALNPNAKSQDDLIKGVLKLLVFAIAIALLSKLFSTFKEYIIRMIVQKFGIQF